MNLEAERLLDRIGLEILSALQEDGRITFSELGKRVGAYLGNYATVIGGMVLIVIGSSILFQHLSA